MPLDNQRVTATRFVSPCKESTSASAGAVKIIVKRGDFRREEPPVATRGKRPSHTWEQPFPHVASDFPSRSKPGRLASHQIFCREKSENSIFSDEDFQQRRDNFSFFIFHFFIFLLYLCTRKQDKLHDYGNSNKTSAHFAACR